MPPKNRNNKKEDYNSENKEINELKSVAFFGKNKERVWKNAIKLNKNSRKKGELFYNHKSSNEIKNLF